MRIRQCSECDKTDDEVKEEEVDTNAPRRLREHIKEPAKFRISIGNDNNLIKGTAGVEKENNEQSTPETTAMGRNRVNYIYKCYLTYSFLIIYIYISVSVFHR